MDRAYWFSCLRANKYALYEASARVIGDTLYVLARRRKTLYFITVGQDDPAFTGVASGPARSRVKICGLTRENCAALQKRFPYTAPVSLCGRDSTIGLGDRLGLCSGAHIAALQGTTVFPVLGQQSKRELTLTGRTYRRMMDDVAWQVFQVGYEGGYAVDGDHLKTMEDVLAAIRDGVTMITLDCSAHLRHEAGFAEPGTAEKACKASFPPACLQVWQTLYLEKRFRFGNSFGIIIDAAKFWPMVWTYGHALFFIKEIYDSAIAPCPRSISFEISMDETNTPTEPFAHYFVAAELHRLGVTVHSLAPRFCGEFQKGIDYIGDLEQFEAAFCSHAAIAECFQYRISIHSGSDKFRVFPCIGRNSGGRFHLKTSGTSWVEAVRVLARYAPALFRRMLAFACMHFEEARQYYQVTADPALLQDWQAVIDQRLPALLDDATVRQILHITYGLLLQAEDPNGGFLFRDALYAVLREHQACLDAAICAHIRKHLTLLGLTANP